jgi:Zn-dependent protease with chaperone function
VDFYAYQAAARRQTRWLVIAFTVAVATVIVALDTVLMMVFAARDPTDPGRTPLQYAADHPDTVLGCSLLVLAVIGLASLYKTLELRGGGAVVARSLGGVRVERDTSDPKRRRLRNVVEEMAIASGVPVPEIYVLEQETAINAFAAGHTPANAAITVTQGALDYLDRDELQGVIGHEFSHILNGDMRLNVQLMGWLFGLLVIALIGRTILRIAPRGRDRRGAGLWLLVALAVMVLGYVGLLAGRILQAAVSRQRERLADASSVQFTRNPLGLKGALLKIAGLAEGSKLSAADAEQVAHMLFAPGLDRVLATHPPLLERIRALDPHFDARELARVAAQGVAATTPPEPDAPPSPAASGVAAFGPNPAAARAIAAQVGAPQTAHVSLAQTLRLRLPVQLREFTEAPGKARVLVLALLLSRDRAVRDAQMRLLPPADLTDLESALEVADGLEPMLRLPALLQLFPALRRVPIADRRALAGLAAALIHADNRVDIFEFCLAKLLETLLHDEMAPQPPHGRLTLEDEAQELHVLFAVLARAGAEGDEQRARVAYESGMQTVLPLRRPAYATYEDWPRRLAAALTRLEQLQPFAKQALIEGLVRTIATDGALNVEEGELLRTTCALLHCPMPILGAAESVAPT